jgi:galactokinase
MALLSQKAENQWVGVNCGIMDQLISATGKAGNAVLIDCRTLERTLAPLPPDTVIMVLDTTTRRGLVDSKYNERRAQCEAAEQFFGVPKLRDVSLETFNQRAHELDDLIRRRARHVITENARTLDAQQAMSHGDAITTGRLMNESHISLRDDFEVSADALNAIVEAAQSHPACYGARMTGGGFGGCACALIQADAVEDFSAHVEAVYKDRTGYDAAIYVCIPSDGAGAVRL